MKKILNRITAFFTVTSIYLLPYMYTTCEYVIQLPSATGYGVNTDSVINPHFCGCFSADLQFDNCDYHWHVNLFYIFICIFFFSYPTMCWFNLINIIACVVCVCIMHRYWLKIRFILISKLKIFQMLFENKCNIIIAKKHFFFAYLAAFKGSFKEFFNFQFPINHYPLYLMYLQAIEKFQI